MFAASGKPLRESMMARPISPNDLYDIRFIHDPKINPKGEEILFCVTQARSEEDYDASIWKYSEGACSPILPPLDAGSKYSQSSWSPMGKSFAYVRQVSVDDDRRCSPYNTELWIADSNGLSRVMLFDLEESKVRGELRWSPDSAKIFFISDYEQDIKPEPAPGRRLSDAKVITRMAYRKDNEGYFFGRREHLFCLDINTKSIHRITSGEYDVKDFDVYPDGRSIVFVSNMSEDADIQINHNLYRVELGDSPSAHPPELLHANGGPISNVAISPSGRKIAFIGHDNRLRSYYNTPFEVWVLDIENRSVTNLCKSIDRQASNSLHSDARMGGDHQRPLWRNDDDDQIYFLATDRMACHIFRASVSTGKVDRVTEGNTVITQFTINDSGDIAFARMEPTKLCEVFILNSEGSERQLTNLNGDLLSELKLSVPSVFTFKARDGRDIEGWIMDPSFKDYAGKPACVVDFHGGGGTQGYQFMLAFQVLCANGFAVLACNFRGTPGYGEKMMHERTYNYCKEDFTDSLDMLDFAISNGWVDEKKVGVAGNSLGGWFTAWAVEHSDKFAAAVATGTCVNMHSYYGTTDDHTALELERDIFDCLPWENPQLYLSISPIQYVERINTPLLLIHSEDDYCVNIEQAEQLFAALRRLRKDAVFVRFPQESHLIALYGKPQHRVDRLGFILWWLTKYIDVNKKIEVPPTR